MYTELLTLTREQIRQADDATLQQWSDEVGASYDKCEENGDCVKSHYKTLRMIIWETLKRRDGF